MATCDSSKVTISVRFRVPVLLSGVVVCAIGFEPIGRRSTGGELLGAVECDGGTTRSERVRRGSNPCTAVGEASRTNWRPCQSVPATAPGLNPDELFYVDATNSGSPPIRPCIVVGISDIEEKGLAGSTPALAASARLVKWYRVTLTP
jgi:hypothetical protein